MNLVLKVWIMSHNIYEINLFTICRDVEGLRLMIIIDTTKTKNQIRYTISLVQNAKSNL